MDAKGTHKKLTIHYLAIIALLAVSTTVLVGDFSVRMALTSADDSPLTAAYFMKNPQAYAQDAFVNNWIHIALGSMQTWLTVGLYNWLGVPPEVPYYIWVYLQNVLLGLAVFRFAMCIKPSPVVAWLSVAFTFLGKVYAWNFAAYGDLMYTSYAGHLALPFLLFAITYALENRPWLSNICFLIGGLFHPALALSTAAILGLFWLWQLRGEMKIRDYLLRNLGLIVCLAISVFPHQISMYGLKQISGQERLALILLNSHTVPWIATDYLPAILNNSLKLFMLLMLAFLGLRKEDLSHTVKAFFIYAALATLILTIGHIIISELRIIPLMRLLLHRSSLLLAIMAVPYAMAYLVGSIQNASNLDRFTIAAALMSPGKYLMVALAAVGLPLAYKGQTKQNTLYRLLSPLAWLGYALTMVMVLPNFLTQASYYFARTVYHITGLEFPWLSLPGLEHVSVYVTLTAALAVIIMRWSQKKQSRGLENIPVEKKSSKYWGRTWVWVIVVMLIGFINFNHVSANLALTDDARAWYDVQIWARMHTKPDSNFTLAGTNPFYSWRSLADRPIVSCYRVEHYYIFGLKAKEYDMKLKKFYAHHCGLKSEDFMQNNVHTCFLSLNREALLDFAHEFHSDYLVTKINKGKFNFPVAYKNSRFIVYRLQ